MSSKPVASDLQEELLQFVDDIVPGVLVARR